MERNHPLGASSGGSAGRKSPPTWPSLCGDRNQRKGGQKITLRQLWRRGEGEGMLMTASQDGLPGLAEMLALATDRHGTMITKKGLM